LGASVKAEFRGDICVVRCISANASSFAEDLRAELRRCLDAGASDVVLDVDSRLVLGGDEIAVLGEAARGFRAGGGELVVAAEEPETRLALAEAGLVRAAVPPLPELGLGGEGATMSLPDRPRWQHDCFFPAAAEELPGARRLLVAFAEVSGLRGTDLFEFSVSVAEALSNALLHGSPHGVDDDIRVRFFSFDDEVAVEVIDSGGGIDATPIRVPAASESGGRGIHFMRALCDDVQFACGPLGTHVLLIKRRS
jgi:anti-sigma regulatory factor (Ser/Thr protein kinase)